MTSPPAEAIAGSDAQARLDAYLAEDHTDFSRLSAHIYEVLGYMKLDAHSSAELVDTARSRLDQHAAEIDRLGHVILELQRQQGNCAICGYIAWSKDEDRREHCVVCALRAVLACRDDHQEN